MRILLIAPLCIVLAGCSGSPLGDTLAGPEKLAQQDEAYCSSIGAAPGTPNYTQCRMNMTTRRDNSHEGYRNRALVGMAIAAEMNRPTPPPPIVTCRTWGNTTTCN
jgi:hypothetical protein